MSPVQLYSDPSFGLLVVVLVAVAFAVIAYHVVSHLDDEWADAERIEELEDRIEELEDETGRPDAVTDSTD